MRALNPKNLLLQMAKLAPRLTHAGLRVLAKFPDHEYGSLVREMAEASGCRVLLDTRLGNGMPMRVVWLDLVSNSIRQHGYFEIDTVEMVRQLLRPGQVFIDVGAHLGQYTLLGAGSGAKVHAFEPNPTTFSVLEQNVRMNGANVELNAVAVSDSSGIVTLYASTLENIGSASIRHPYNFSGTTYEVKCVTLDKYGVKPDLLKVDAEGAELLVLRGGKQVLAHRPPIVLEFAELWQNKFGTKCSDLEEYLQGLGYRLSLIGRNGAKLPYRRPGPREFLNVLASVEA